MPLRNKTGIPKAGCYTTAGEKINQARRDRLVELASGNVGLPVATYPVAA